MNTAKRGIVLVTIMLLISIVIMIAALLIISGKNTLLLGADYSDREQAYYAAESGVAYIQYCISRFKDYKADSDTLDSVYNPGFTDFNIEAVKGQSRCLRGILNNGKSEFYVCFYDGGAWNKNNDGRVDNNGKILNYYSYNGLSNASDAITTHYDGFISSKFRDVPKYTAHIIVEGRSGKAIKYVETMLNVSTSDQGASSCLSANGIEVGLTDSDSTFLVNTAAANEGKIRSMGDIIVASGEQDDKNCYQVANGGLSGTGGENANGSTITKYTYINGTKIATETTEKDYGVSCDNKSQKKYFENSRLKWSDVADKYFDNGSYTGNVKTTIQSGTWVYKNSKENPSTYKLYYYPDALTSANANTFADDCTGYEYSTWTGNPLIGGNKSGIEINDNVNMDQFSKSGKYLVTIKNSTGVMSDEKSGNKNFAVSVYDYDGDTDKFAPSDKYRASVRIDGDAKNDPSLVSMPGGNIAVNGELSGCGKVLSGGTLTFQGRSILDADPSSGMSVYSQGTVTIDPTGNTTGGSTDPNIPIKQAWSSIVGGNTSADGYYNTNEKDIKKLRDKILSTSVNGKQLKNILTEDYGNDISTAQEMVTTLLTKNSFIGKDTTVTKTVTSDAKKIDDSESITIGGSKVSVYKNKGETYIKITDSSGQTTINKVAKQSKEDKK